MEKDGKVAGETAKREEQRGLNMLPRLLLSVERKMAVPCRLAIVAS